MLVQTVVVVVVQTMLLVRAVVVVQTVLLLQAVVVVQTAVPYPLVQSRQSPSKDSHL